MIAAPLKVESGAIVVCAPDKFPGSLEIPVENGWYRITAAMEDFDEVTEAVDLFIEKTAQPMAHSELLLGDPMTESAWKEKADVNLFTSSVHLLQSLVHSRLSSVHSRQSAVHLLYISLTGITAPQARNPLAQHGSAG